MSQEPSAVVKEGEQVPDGGEEAAVPGATLRQYLLSIVYMPKVSTNFYVL